MLPLSSQVSLPHCPAEVGLDRAAYGRPPQPPAPLHVGLGAARPALSEPQLSILEEGCHAPTLKAPFQLSKPMLLSLKMHTLLPREPLGLAFAVLGWPSELLAFRKQQVRWWGAGRASRHEGKALRQREGLTGSSMPLMCLALKRGSLGSLHPRHRKGQNLGGEQCQ